MSASLAAAADTVRTEHDVHMLSARCRVGITRDGAGRIVGLDAVQADDKRRKLIEAAGRGLASGLTVEEGMLNSTAFGDLWRELCALNRPAR